MTFFNVIRTFAFAILGWYVFGLPAQAAGLECRKAKTTVERLICDGKSSPGLYSLDSALNKFYSELLKRPENKQAIIAEQKKWLTEVRNVCADADCLKRAYRARVNELQPIATLCSVQEVVVFSCTLPASKLVSLCSSQDAGPNTGYMQYRMGSNQNSLETQFPEQKHPAKDTFKFLGDSLSGTYGVSFWSGNTRYNLYQNKNRRRADMTKPWASLSLSRAQPPVEVSRLDCVGDPVAFNEWEGYSPISFYFLGETLELPDADKDIREGAGGG